MGRIRFCLYTEDYWISNTLSAVTYRGLVKNLKEDHKEKGNKARKKNIPGSAHSDNWLHSLLISVIVAVAAVRFPWSLWLLHGRSLHGNHYPRLHVLNQGDCRTERKPQHKFLICKTVFTFSFPVENTFASTKKCLIGLVMCCNWNWLQHPTVALTRLLKSIFLMNPLKYT